MRSRARTPPACPPGTVAAAMAELRDRVSDLELLPMRPLVRDLDRVARAWLDPSGPLRREAVERVAGEARLSPQGVAWGLDAAFAALTGPALEQLLDRDVPDPVLLAAPRLRPRGVSVHVQAGNVFTAALPSLFASLLARCPALLKAPTGQPAFGELLERSFRDHGGRLAGAVRALHWRGGDEEVERPALTAADVVLAYGSDETVASLRARAGPRTLFRAFGDRTSIAVVDRESALLHLPLLEGIALDVCAYDQRGCLSPLVLYVEEGGAVSPRDFAEALAVHGFPTVSRALPAGPLDEASSAARYHHLEVARFEGEVWEGEGFAVCFRPGSRYESGCAARVLDVRPYPAGSDLRAELGPLDGRLQGVAAAVDGSDLPRLVRVTGELGASRVCRPGHLQRPPLSWHHEGASVLAPFLHFVDVE